MSKFSEFLNNKLLSEIDRSSIDNIDLERELLFNNIFGQKLRIVIPLSASDDLEQLINFLEEIGYEVDYEDLVNKKVAYKIIKTQQGTKKRPEKIGGILQNLVKNSNNKNLALQMLDWWQKNGDKLKNSKDGQSIIISRSPIDLVRMSDHDGISSCHSPDRSHFKCAKQEARTGGAVAYVVNNEDLEGVDLQKPEIFRDDDRDVDGIEPLERIRLRRFTHKNNKIDLLVPELRTYGTSHVGLKKIIKNWAKLAQKDVLDSMDPNEDYEKFQLRGGTYQDSNAPSIWNDFLNTKVTGSKYSADEDEERSGDKSAENMEELAQQQLDQHRGNWDHFDVSFDVQDDGDAPYIYYSAYATFEIPVGQTTANFPKVNGYNLSREGGNNSPYTRNWGNLRKVEDIIKKSIDIYSIDNIDWSINKKGDKVYYSVNISVYSDDGTSDLDGFEGFLDYIDEIDNDFNSNINKVYAALSTAGYMKNENLNDAVNFEHFDVEYDEEEGEYTITSKPEKIGFLKDYEGEVTSSYGPEGKRLGILSIQNKIKYGQLSLIPFIENKYIEIFFSSRTSSGWADKTFSTDTAEKTKITGPVYVSVKKTIKAFDSKTKGQIVAQIKQLDKNWMAYLQKVVRFFDFFTKIEKEPTETIYQKLVNKDMDLTQFQKPTVIKRPTKDPQKKLSFKEFYYENV